MNSSSGMWTKWPLSLLVVIIEMYFSISLFISVKDKSPCFTAHSQQASSEGKGEERRGGKIFRKQSYTVRGSGGAKWSRGSLPLPQDVITTVNTSLLLCIKLPVPFSFSHTPRAGGRSRQVVGVFLILHLHWWRTRPWSSCENDESSPPPVELQAQQGDKAWPRQTYWAEYVAFLTPS